MQRSTGSKVSTIVSTFVTAIKSLYSRSPRDISFKSAAIDLSCLNARSKGRQCCWKHLFLVYEEFADATRPRQRLINGCDFISSRWYLITATGKHENETRAAQILLRWILFSSRSNLLLSEFARKPPSSYDINKIKLNKEYTISRSIIIPRERFNLTNN